MMNEHLKSLDATLAAAKDAWAAEKKALEDHLFASQTELSLVKDQLARAEDRCAQAERTTMKLLTQFAVVSQVFDEARHVAIRAGWNTDPEPDTDPVLKAKAAIEAAINPVPTSEPSNVPS